MNRLPCIKPVADLSDMFQTHTGTSFLYPPPPPHNIVRGGWEGILESGRLPVRVSSHLCSEDNMFQTTKPYATKLVLLLHVQTFYDVCVCRYIGQLEAANAQYIQQTNDLKEVSWACWFLFGLTGIVQVS